MRPSSDRHGALSIALVMIAGAVCLIALAEAQGQDLAEQLVAERQRRREVEGALRRRENDLDGALETIHELQGDDGE